MSNLGVQFPGGIGAFECPACKSRFGHWASLKIDEETVRLTFSCNNHHHTNLRLSNYEGGVIYSTETVYGVPKDV